MPRICTACSHPDRPALDAALVSRNVPIRDLAGTYGLSKSAVDRHAKDCLPAALVQAEEAREVAAAGTLLEQVQALQARTLTLLSKAEEAGDLGTALRAVREVRANLELLGKLAGELAQEGTINVTVVHSPQWVEIRTTLVAALAPYPDARVAAAEALARIQE